MGEYSKIWDDYQPYWVRRGARYIQMVDILAEALIASVSNKKIIVICRDNEIKERLLKVAREYGVESAIEIKVLRHDIGKRAEDVIIDEFEEVTHNED